MIIRRHSQAYPPPPPDFAISFTFSGVRPLKGVESRMQSPDLDLSPAQELRRGLVPQLPAVADQPRVMLKRERESHRRECEGRETRWETELKEKLTTAEEVWELSMKRRGGGGVVPKQSGGVWVWFLGDVDGIVLFFVPLTVCMRKWTALLFTVHFVLFFVSST